MFEMIADADDAQRCSGTWRFGGLRSFFVFLPPVFGGMNGRVVKGVGQITAIGVGTAAFIVPGLYRAVLPGFLRVYVFPRMQPRIQGILRRQVVLEKGRQRICEQNEPLLSSFAAVGWTGLISTDQAASRSRHASSVSHRLYPPAGRLDKLQRQEKIQMQGSVW